MLSTITCADHSGTVEINFIMLNKADTPWGYFMMAEKISGKIIGADRGIIKNSFGSTMMCSLANQADRSVYCIHRYFLCADMFAIQTSVTISQGIIWCVSKHCDIQKMLCSLRYGNSKKNCSIFLLYTLMFVQ